VAGKQLDIMTNPIKFLSIILTLCASIIISACQTEDPGPLQAYEKEFSLIDFDRLGMGNAFNIHVTQGNTFSIRARGDRRNIDDLNVFKSGNTLVIEFSENGHRNHETDINITMPRLEAVNFSGASESRIVGFDNGEGLDLFLSGASICQLNADYRQVDIILSGASSLRMFGIGEEIKAGVSGASVLRAFDYPVDEAAISLSGASSGRVYVASELQAAATGASTLLYRGFPSVTSSVSGASSVRHE
jgi:hypothetical protein